MLHAIEDHFAASGRTPKGRQALRSIFRATYRTVSEKGSPASLDRIADRAGLSQAALRHYFATRDELLTGFFTLAVDWFQSRITEMLAESNVPARLKLERCLAQHLEYMEGVDTVFWLEASAFWLRKARHRRIRDQWYRWLLGQYAGLIGQMRPALGPRERKRIAYAVLTLVLGAWITHGRGSSVDDEGNVVQRRKRLVATALNLVEY